MARDGVDRSEARDGLTRDLTQVLPRDEDVRGLQVRNRVGQPNHQALRQDEVEAPVGGVGDLGEGLPHANHVQRRNFQNPA